MEYFPIKKKKPLWRLVSLFPFSNRTEGRQHLISAYASHLLQYYTLLLTSGKPPCVPVREKRVI